MYKSIAIKTRQPALGGAALGVRSIKLEVLGRHRSVPHLGRKFYHFLMGITCFSLYAFFLTREQSLFLLVVLGGSFVIADFFRLRYATVNNLVLKYFGGLMRREELKSISGNSFYVLGLIFVVLFFPKPIVLLSVLFLAVGDPIAAVIGTLYGKHKIIGKKSLEGAVANLFCSSAAAFLLGYFYLHLSFEKAVVLAILGGITSVAAELCPVPVDDNFSIPALSAVFLTLITSVLPII